MTERGIEFGRNLAKSLDLTPDELKGLLLGIFEQNLNKPWNDAILMAVTENFTCAGKDVSTGEYELEWK